MKFAWCLMPCAIALSVCSSDAERADEVALDNPWGFKMRVTQEVELHCPDCGGFGGGSARAEDKDFVCTFTTDGRDAVLYLQATPTSVRSAGFAAVPVYDEVSAFIAKDGVVRELSGAGYDAGGGHRNDFFFFTIGEVRYTFNHSSFGPGFRVCHPPDCVTREEGDAFVDGCQPERTLAEACIAVVDPLPPLVDNFAPCRGDVS